MTAGADTILVKGTIEVTDTQNWELPNNAILKRAQGFDGVLIDVKAEGILNLHDIVIDGGSLEGMHKSDFLIMVDTEGLLSVNEGAVLQNNDMSLRKGNTFTFHGGGIYVRGTIDMTGGRIENCIATMGGGHCFR